MIVLYAVTKVQAKSLQKTNLSAGQPIEINNTHEKELSPIVQNFTNDEVTHEKNIVLFDLSRLSDADNSQQSGVFQELFQKLQKLYDDSTKATTKNLQDLAVSLKNKISKRVLNATLNVDKVNETSNNTQAPVSLHVNDSSSVVLEDKNSTNASQIISENDVRAQPSNVQQLNANMPIQINGNDTLNVVSVQGRGEDQQIVTLHLCHNRTCHHDTGLALIKKQKITPNNDQYSGQNTYNQRSFSQSLYQLSELGLNDVEKQLKQQKENHNLKNQEYIFMKDIPLEDNSASDDSSKNNYDLTLPRLLGDKQADLNYDSSQGFSNFNLYDINSKGQSTNHLDNSNSEQIQDNPQHLNNFMDIYNPNLNYANLHSSDSVVPIHIQQQKKFQQQQSKSQDSKFQTNDAPKNESDNGESDIQKLKSNGYEIKQSMKCNKQQNDGMIPVPSYEISFSAQQKLSNQNEAEVNGQKTLSASQQNLKNKINEVKTAAIIASKFQPSKQQTAKKITIKEGSQSVTKSKKKNKQANNFGTQITSVKSKEQTNKLNQNSQKTQIATQDKLSSLNQRELKSKFESGRSKQNYKQCFSSTKFNMKMPNVERERKQVIIPESPKASIKTITENPLSQSTDLRELGPQNPFYQIENNDHGKILHSISIEASNLPNLMGDTYAGTGEQGSIAVPLDYETAESGNKNCTMAVRVRVRVHESDEKKMKEYKNYMKKKNFQMINNEKTLKEAQLQKIQKK